jgi:hypothetical protein
MPMYDTCSSIMQSVINHCSTCMVLSWNPRSTRYTHASNATRSNPQRRNTTQSSKTANSEPRRRFASSQRAFAGIMAAPQLFRSRLLGQLPLLPAAPAFARLPEGRTMTTGGLRRDCIFFAAWCNCSRRLLSSKGGRQRPLRAAGSRRVKRLLQRLHCSIDLSLRVSSRARAGSEPRRLDKGPMSLPCWQAIAREERRR